MFMTSCTVTESYYLTGKTEKIIVNDTIILPATHIHYEDIDCDKFCIYIEEWVCDYTDTLYVEVIKRKKKIRLK